MLVEKVIGNLNDDQFKNKNVDYVDIEWHEAFKKLHKKTSKNGCVRKHRISHRTFRRSHFYIHEQ